MISRATYYKTSSRTETTDCLKSKWQNICTRNPGNVACRWVSEKRGSKNKSPMVPKIRVKFKQKLDVHLAGHCSPSSGSHPRHTRDSC